MSAWVEWLSIQEFKTIPSATLILFNGYECYVGSKVSPVVTASVIGHCYTFPWWWVFLSVQISKYNQKWVCQILTLHTSDKAVQITTSNSKRLHRYIHIIVLVTTEEGKDRIQLPIRWVVPVWHCSGIYHYSHRGQRATNFFFQHYKLTVQEQMYFLVELPKSRVY